MNSSLVTKQWWADIREGMMEWFLHMGIKLYLNGRECICRKRLKKKLSWVLGCAIQGMIQLKSLNLQFEWLMRKESVWIVDFLKFCKSVMELGHASYYLFFINWYLLDQSSPGIHTFSELALVCVLFLSRLVLFLYHSNKNFQERCHHSN